MLASISKVWKENVYENKLWADSGSVGLPEECEHREPCTNSGVATCTCVWDALFPPHARVSGTHCSLHMYVCLGCTVPCTRTCVWDALFPAHARVSGTHCPSSLCSVSYRNQLHRRYSRGCACLLWISRLWHSWHPGPGHPSVGGRCRGGCPGLHTHSEPPWLPPTSAVSPPQSSGFQTGKLSLVDKNHLCLRTSDLIQIFPKA